MGSLCSKEIDNSPSNRPIQTLGSSSRTAPVPPRQKPQKIGGPARALGGSTVGGSAAANAAFAAESRATAISHKPKGPLAKSLEAQRKLMHTDTLKKAAADELLRRQAEAQVDIRAYN